MAKDARTDRIPTYEESQSHARSHASLSAQLALARTARIDALINAHILPQIQAQVDAGLHGSTIVLVPSDSGARLDGSSTGASKDDGTAIASIIPAADGQVQDLPASDQSITLLQLHSSGQNAAFWTQKGTVSALALGTRTRLMELGHAVEDDQLMPASGPSAAQSPPPRRKGFFRRAADATGDRIDPGVGVLHRSTGAPSSTFDAGRAVAVVQPGWIRVSVESRDVAVRCCSPMGLYETRSGTAVVLRVEIGVQE